MSIVFWWIMSGFIGAFYFATDGFSPNVDNILGLIVVSLIFGLIFGYFIGVAALLIILIKILQRMDECQ